MNKFWKYIAGVVKSLRGEYPYEQLEHLEYIKKQLINDDEHLNAEHPSIKVLTARHVSICGEAWRGSYLLPHAPLRNKLKRLDKDVVQASQVKKEILPWQEMNAPQLLFVENNT